MSDISKYTAILTQFGEKLQTHINKKYKPFLKTLLSQTLQQKTKSWSSKQQSQEKQQKDKQKAQKLVLTQEMIAFKLGIQSKSTKCIEMTLTSLLKLFIGGFVDLGQRNYCDDFVITQANIQKKKSEGHDREMRSEVVKWLEPLVHFKNNQINSLVLKIYQFMIGEPILHSLIDISSMLGNQQCFNLIYSFFNYRFYLFEEVYEYSKAQISQFKHITTNQRLSGQINNALNREQALQNLVQRYLNQVITKIVGDGGKYGFCVVCDQPADYFCKITKASLCGIDCKNKHLEIAQKHYKSHLQSIIIQKSIRDSIKILAKQLSQRQSPFLFSILATLLEKPYLFQLVKSEYKAQIRNNLPAILYKAYESKNEQIAESLYFMMSSLAKWWPAQCLPEVQFFIKDHVLKVLADKKPSFRSLVLLFKSLDKIFEQGRSVVQLFVNLDCQINQLDAIGSILFQLSKISQDRFANSMQYSKQQKIAIKNSCVTLFTTLSRSLNDFRRNYPNQMNVAEITDEKSKKSDLQKFVHKFNEHWSQGLKTLFNLNLVGLDSNHEIVNIIMSLAGLNKKMIDLMLFDKHCQQYLQFFMSRLKEENQPLLFKLLSLYKFIPMTENNSIGILKFVEAFDEFYKMPDLLATVKKITSILIKFETFDDFKNKIKQYTPADADFKYLFLRALTARKQQTIGKKKRVYILCLSKSYLEPLSTQITLLQIPLSYMLETNYDADKIVNLIKQLVSICIHSNWLALLVKHSGIDAHSQNLLTPYNIKIIKGILEIAVLQADFIVDWLTVLTFISNLYYLLTSNHSKKHLIENKTTLSQQISQSFAQNSLVNISIKCVNNFSKFMASVLTIARQQLANQQIMMLQKFFHLLDANVDKYIANFELIFDEFRKFVIELKPKTSSQTYIYVVDMLKQLLLKVLKSKDVDDQITVEHLAIFGIILAKNKDNKQVGDFVMNSLSTIVVYNYNLKTKAWREVIKIVDQQASLYTYQTGVIIRKILNEHMKNIEDESQKLLKICLKLMTPQNEKSSVEAIHDIKLILDLQRELVEADLHQVDKQSEAKQEVIEDEIKNLKRLLQMSIEELVKIIGQNFSESVAQTLFLLFNTKLNQEINILSQDQINAYIYDMFERLEGMDKQRRQTAQRIMNQTLYWSAKNKNKGIVKNLQRMVIGKYTSLSLTALKCIKTYIQMSNLRDQKQWQEVTQTLLQIIECTQVERYFKLEPQNLDQVIKAIMENNYDNDKMQEETQVNVDVFVHQCRVQMMSVQLLPNHRKSLPTLLRIYSGKTQFNDNVAVRMMLQKKGIGKEFPPDLLNLEQTISNRIMAIYLWENDSKEVLHYTLQILKKYLSSTKVVQQLQQSHSQVLNNQDISFKNQEIYEIYEDYWNKRRQPLVKLLNYIMPKLSKHCQTQSERKELMLNFVQLMPVFQSKQPVLKLISELAQKKFD